MACHYLNEIKSLWQVIDSNADRLLAIGRHLFKSLTQDVNQAHACHPLPFHEHFVACGIGIDFQLMEDVIVNAIATAVDGLEHFLTAATLKAATRMKGLGAHGIGDDGTRGAMRTKIPLAVFVVRQFPDNRTRIHTSAVVKIIKILTRPEVGGHGDVAQAQDLIERRCVGDGQIEIKDTDTAIGPCYGVPIVVGFSKGLILPKIGITGSHRIK